MIVFTSMKYTDITLTSASGKGVRSMREFLRFAEDRRCFQDAAADTVRSEGTRILADIAETLRENGYDSNFNVGTSHFKVDIGIINPDRPTDYLLGLLSDGESYRQSENTRDREYARADVLKRLGWNLMHVWSVEWYFNKQKTLETILGRLKDLRENNPAPTEEVRTVDPNFGLSDAPAEDPEEQVSGVRAASSAVPYVPAEIPFLPGADIEDAT